MTDRSLAEIAEKMRDIDIAMLSTDAGDGAIASRPMSNNGEVEWDGDSFYFTWDQSRMVADIGRNPKVGLTFNNGDGFWLSVSGRAEIMRDKAAFADHWTDGLHQWFEDGVDTPGLVLIKVGATRAKYWDGENEGEVTLTA